MSNLKDRLGSTFGLGAGVRPENIIWIFGTARSGSTWLSTMLGDLKGCREWREPFVGLLFGPSFFTFDWGRQLRRERFILHRKHRDAWIGPVRDLVLRGAASRFRRMTRQNYL